jgi:hypothetical protein
MSVNQRGMRRQTFVVTVNGLSASGGIGIGDVHVGDIIENVRNIVSGASASGSFETSASVLNEVQQTSSSNLAGNTYDVIVTPQS